MSILWKRKKKHPIGTQYVCGDCTQKLINISAEEGVLAYEKAKRIKSFRQMKAITIVKGIKNIG